MPHLSPSMRDKERAFSLERYRIFDCEMILPVACAALSQIEPYRCWSLGNKWVRPPVLDRGISVLHNCD
jgi:hypothetical protein